MSVIFESNVKVAEDGNWYIELVDTSDGTKNICNNTDEYEKNYGIMIEPYGGDFDIEVKWTKSKELRPNQINEILDWMSKLSNEVDDLKNENDS